MPVEIFIAEVGKHSSTWPSASMYFIDFPFEFNPRLQVESLRPGLQSKAQSWKRKGEMWKRVIFQKHLSAFPCGRNVFRKMISPAVAFGIAISARTNADKRKIAPKGGERTLKRKEGVNF
jgi:hypothetical protein